MSRTTLYSATLLTPLLLAAAGCHRGPDIGGIPVVQSNPATIPDNQAAYAAAAAQRADAMRSSLNAEAGANANAALANCTPDICAAIGRGELAIGMTRPQVLAATSSSSTAWTMRGSDGGGTLVPSASGNQRIADRVGEVMMVTFRGGRAISYTYREASGLRTVQNAAEATLDGRRHAEALALLEQGDQMVAASRPDDALARYDQADVIEPNNPGTTLRLARLLDQQMRGLEALMRYQKFLYEMEIGRIDAHGRANAELSGAMLAAQARVVHLTETLIKK